MSNIVKMRLIAGSINNFLHSKNAINRVLQLKKFLIPSTHLNFQLSIFQKQVIHLNHQMQKNYSVLF